MPALQISDMKGSLMQAERRTVWSKERDGGLEKQPDGHVAPWQGTQSKHRQGFSCSWEGGSRGGLAFVRVLACLKTREGGVLKQGGGHYGRVDSSVGNSGVF